MEKISSRTREIMKRHNNINSKGDCLMYFHFLSLIKRLVRSVITKKPAIIWSRINRFTIHRSDKWNPNFKNREMMAAIPKIGVMKPII
jgi:hypothetical protein